MEAIAERPDGTRVPFLPYPTPLRDATGQLVGALLVDLTERRRARKKSKSAQLAAIVFGPAATVETARKLITHEQCDAALLDVNLSGHPVDELAAALTKHAVPFAFLTGYGREALPRGIW